MILNLFLGFRIRLVHQSRVITLATDLIVLKSKRSRVLSHESTQVHIRSFSGTFLVPIGQRSVTISDETINFKSTSDSLSRYFFCRWRLKTFFGSKMIEIEKKKKGKRFNSFVFSLFQQSSGLQSFCQKLKRWKYNFQLPITLSIQNFLALSLSPRLSYTLTHSLSLSLSHTPTLSLTHTPMPIV